MSHLAPAGTAIAPHTAATALLAGLFDSSRHPRLAQALATHAGRERGELVSTGRAAMVMGLKAMHALAPARTEVIVAAYTCYSVPASVKLAGLTPRLVDVDPATLSPDLAALERLDTSRVLAIVSANLYGIPNDLAALEAFASKRGIYLLDDAAQALGASLAGRAVGSFGDAGLYSFDKGKNITSIEGGALTASGALAQQLMLECASLSPTSAAHTAITAAKLLVYSLMLRPAAYGLVQKLPLGLGATRWEDDYPLARYSPVLAGVALRLYSRLDELTATRAANAQRLADSVRDLPGVTLPRLLPGAVAAWTRFPLFIADASRRTRAMAALNLAGIGATGSYPQALGDVPEAAKLLPSGDLAQPGARAVAASIVTLPTHAYVPAEIGARVRAVLLKV